MDITEFLGLPVEEWFGVKRIIDVYFDGDVDRLKRHFKHVKVDQCSNAHRNFTYYTAWKNSRVEVNDLKTKIRNAKKCLKEN